MNEDEFAVFVVTAAVGAWSGLITLEIAALAVVSALVACNVHFLRSW
jgi:hypothetical protein